MLDFNSLNTLFYTVGDFSRNNCASICTFLVPANPLATLQTIIIFVALYRPPTQLKLEIAFATLYAATVILHVFTWFIAGVVMAPTFILPSIAIRNHL
jgi:hypothetical protein